MGCGKICQAKKKAKAAEKKAADARRQAASAKKGASGPQPTSVSANIITVADVLNVKEKYGALTPLETFVIVGSGRRNSQIARSAARSMITPVRVAFGTYMAMIVAQVVGRVVKPVVKIAQQINDIVTFNFAAIGELLADVALMLVTVFVGLAPIFLSLLKNVFFTVPLGINILTEYQYSQLASLIQLGKIQIKNAFQRVVLNINGSEVVERHNATRNKVATLGGTTPTGLIDFSGLSNNLSTAIENSPAPFDLNSLLALFPSLGFPATTLDDIRNDYVDSFTAGMKSAREQILQDLSSELSDDKYDVDILRIDDVASMDLEDKNAVKEVASGTNDASKKIELLQAGEVLKRKFAVSGQIPTEEGQVFDDNDLAVAAANNMIDLLERAIDTASNEKVNSGTGAADSGNNMNIDADEPFLIVFNDEVDKKKKQTAETREDLAAIDLATDVIENHKFQFIDSMTNVVDDIDLDSSDDVNLAPCYESSISTQFSNLKSTTFTQETAFINNYTVNNTNDMLALRDSVYANVQQAVNDALITVSEECQSNFGESVCNSISSFKRSLYARIKEAIQAGTININAMDIPEGIDKYEFKKMLDLLLVEVKKRLLDQAHDIIVSEVVPCKACKPCEDMVADIGIYVSKSINKSKDNIIKNVEGIIINNTNLDWTITDAQSVTDKKNLLISQLNIALSKDAGELRLVDDMLFRLKQEEKELIKNVRLALDALTE